MSGVAAALEVASAVESLLEGPRGRRDGGASLSDVDARALFWRSRRAGGCGEAGVLNAPSWRRSGRSLSAEDMRALFWRSSACSGEKAETAEPAPSCCACSLALPPPPAALESRTAFRSARIARRRSSSSLCVMRLEAAPNERADEAGDAATEEEAVISASCEEEAVLSAGPADPVERSRMERGPSLLAVEKRADMLRPSDGRSHAVSELLSAPESDDSNAELEGRPVRSGRRSGRSLVADEARALF